MIKPQSHNVRVCQKLRGMTVGKIHELDSNSWWSHYLRYELLQEHHQEMNPISFCNLETYFIPN